MTFHIDIANRRQQAMNRTSQITLTPAMATQFMAKNTNNRPLSKATVRLYAAAMKRGEWKYNGDSIRFAASGVLIDGQHRLAAVIASDVPIVTDIIEGLPEDVFKTVDGGKRRVGGDILSIAGEKNTNVLAAAARAFSRVYLSADPTAMTSSYLSSVVNDHPTLRWWSSKYAASKCKAFMPSSFVGVCAAYSEKYGTEPISIFFDSVADGVGLEKGSPALVLREKFMERKRGQSFGQELILAYIIKAMNAYVTGKKLGILRMFDNEKFPQIA